MTQPTGGIRRGTPCAALHAQGAAIEAPGGTAERYTRADVEQENHAMTNTSAGRTRAATSEDDSGRRRIFAALTGLAALAILLQGLWAGMFLEHDGQRDAAENWIEVHATDGEVAIGLAALATIWALVRLRDRRDLVIGAIVLTVLLVLEAYIGGLIVDDGKDSLTPLHIPFALLLMAVAVWLPFRAGRATEPAAR
jgi:hypothetical protein